MLDLETKTYFGSPPSVVKATVVVIFINKNYMQDAFFFWKGWDKRNNANRHWVGRLGYEMVTQPDMQWHAGVFCCCCHLHMNACWISFAPRLKWTFHIPCMGNSQHFTFDTTFSVPIRADEASVDLHCPDQFWLNPLRVRRLVGKLPPLPFVCQIGHISPGLHCQMGVSNLTAKRLFYSAEVFCQIWQTNDGCDR